MYHLGLIHPKSRRTFDFSAFLESRTFALPFSRINKTQCQNGLPCSIRHLMARRVLSSNCYQDSNGVSFGETEIPKSRKSVRTYSVPDQSDVSDA